MLKSSISRLLVLIVILVAGLSAADTVTDAEQSFIKEHMNSDDRVVLKQAFDKYNQDHAVQGADRNLALQAGYVAVRKAQIARGLVMPGAEQAKQSEAAPAAADAPAAAHASADVAAKIKELEDGKAKIDEAGVAFKAAVLAAYEEAYSKHMDFIATLNLNPLSDKLPPDPRASDMQRRDRIRSLNMYLNTLSGKLNDWKEAHSTPGFLAQYKKGLLLMDRVEIDMLNRSFRMDPGFFKLYIELKIQSQIPEEKPDTTGVIDPRKKP